MPHSEGEAEAVPAPSEVTAAPEEQTLEGARVAPRLVVTTAQGTREFCLDRETLILGRDPTSDIVVDDRVVSRRHARFQRTPDGYAIEDLGSVNGLTFRGVQVPKRLLGDGDVLRITPAVSLTYTIEPARDQGAAAPLPSAAPRASRLDGFARFLAPLLGQSPSNAKTQVQQGLLVTILGIVGVVFTVIKVAVQFFDLITHSLSPLLVALPYVILLLFFGAGVFSFYAIVRSTSVMHRERAAIGLAIIVVAFTALLVVVAVAVDVLTRVWLLPIVSR